MCIQSMYNITCYVYITCQYSGAKLNFSMNKELKIGAVVEKTFQTELEIFNNFSSAKALIYFRQHSSNI